MRCVPHFINRKLFILKKRQIGFPIFHPKPEGKKNVSTTAESLFAIEVKILGKINDSCVQETAVEY